MATWAASLLAPSAAELGEARRTIERQAGQLGDLRERVGALTEQVGGREREPARSLLDIATLEDEVQAAERSRRRGARRLILASAVLFALLVLMLAAPAWAR